MGKKKTLVKHKTRNRVNHVGRKCGSHMYPWLQNKELGREKTKAGLLIVCLLKHNQNGCNQTGKGERGKQELSMPFLIN